MTPITKAADNLRTPSEPDLVFTNEGIIVVPAAPDRPKQLELNDITA